MLRGGASPVSDLGHIGVRRPGHLDRPNVTRPQVAIAVGTLIAECPPHGPGRALISASGSYRGWITAKRTARPHTRPPVGHAQTRSVSGTCQMEERSPRSAAFPPHSPPTMLRLCSN